MKTPEAPRRPQRDFFEDVWAVVRLVPPGRVTTYGAIAQFLGMRSGARQVGYAMNAAHTEAPDVPAHRVVNRNGLLTGKHHFGAPGRMAALLAAEGVAVDAGDCVVGFPALLWEPARELAGGF